MNNENNINQTNNESNINNENTNINNLNLNTNSSVPNIDNNYNMTNVTNVTPQEQIQEQTVSPDLIEPQVATVTTSNNNANENSPVPPKKTSNFKYIFAFIFLVGIVAFVFFLPEITKFVESKKQQKTNTSEKNKIENGIMTCTFTKKSDETDTSYTVDYTFEHEKLVTTNFVTTIDSLNNNLLNSKKTECDQAAAISTNITGITTECSLSSSIFTKTEKYTLEDIEKDKLTPYVEAGGIYPEFYYQKNIYDIGMKMKKKGYDCSIERSYNE